MQRRYERALVRNARAAVAAVGLALLAVIAPAAAQDEETGLAIALNEWENSGVSGWAALTPDGDGVRVEMAVEGAEVTGDHPTHIHIGTCDDPDPNPLFPLSTVILDPLSADGTSVTTVEDVTLDELLADDFVILVHPSESQLTPYLVCGDINRANAIPAPDAASAGSVTAPSTGAGGDSAPGRAGGILPTALGAAAAALIGARMLRRRAAAVR